MMDMFRIVQDVEKHHQAKLERNTAITAALRWTRRNTTMYDVTITNCETLEITRKQVQNPLEALSGIEWAEMSGQNQVEAQYDFRITTKKGEIIHIKAREMT